MSRAKIALRQGYEDQRLTPWFQQGGQPGEGEIGVLHMLEHDPADGEVGAAGAPVAGEVGADLDIVAAGGRATQRIPVDVDAVHRQRRPLFGRRVDGRRLAAAHVTDPQAVREMGGHDQASELGVAIDPVVTGHSWSSRSLTAVCRLRMARSIQVHGRRSGDR